MYELLAIGYGSVEAAEAARSQLVALADRYLVEVADAAVAGADGRRRIRLERMVDLWPTEPDGRPNWGSVAAMLQRHPAVNASARGSGSLARFGIDDAYMTQLAELAHSSGAVLLVLARRVNIGPVLETLHQTPEAVLRCEVDPTPGRSGEQAPGASTLTA